MTLLAIGVLFTASPCSFSGPANVPVCVFDANELQIALRKTLRRGTGVKSRRAGNLVGCNICRSGTAWALASPAKGYHGHEDTRSRRHA